MNSNYDLIFAKTKEKIIFIQINIIQFSHLLVTKAILKENNSLYQRLKPLIYKEFEWSECRVSNSGPRGPKF